MRKNMDSFHQKKTFFLVKLLKCMVMKKHNCNIVSLGQWTGPPQQEWRCNCNPTDNTPTESLGGNRVKPHEHTTMQTRNKQTFHSTGAESTTPPSKLILAEVSAAADRIRLHVVVTTSADDAVLHAEPSTFREFAQCQPPFIGRLVAWSGSAADAEDLAANLQAGAATCTGLDASANAKRGAFS